MPTLDIQAVSQKSPCDVFLKDWDAKIDRSNRAFLAAGLVWHVLELGTPDSKLRQKLGILSWSLWWFRHTLRALFRPCSADRVEAGEIVTFAFLPTPAHQDTLEPLLEEMQSLSPARLKEPGNPAPGQIFQIPEYPPSLFGGVVSLCAIFRLLTTIRCFKKLDFWVSGRLAEQLYSFLTVFQWTKLLIEPRGVLFLTYELHPWLKSLASLWRQSDKRVIHVMHGQRLDFYQHTEASDLVLFSKVDEPWFRQRVDPSVRIWTIGHPRLESVRKLVGKPVQHERTRLPRITFFSQPVEGKYSRSLRIADWKLLSALNGCAEVRLRAHPRESRENIERDLFDAGLTFITISEAGLIDDLKWSDGVASSWSTVSMEAAACGRGIFWTCSSPERYEASQELRDHGIGVLIQHAAEWDQYLANWQRNGWQPSVVVSESRLRELGMIGDMDKTWTERLEIEIPDENLPKK